MANIKKGARAYYADTDYRRDGMNEAYSKIDSMPAIPTPEESDVGKVIKVGENGAYELGAGDSGDLLPTTIFSPTTPIGAHSNQPIDFDLKDLNLYKFMAVYYRWRYDDNQMSCSCVPVNYVEYCIDNDLYMAITGFENRFILFKFSILDNVPSIVTNENKDYDIYKIILYR